MIVDQKVDETSYEFTIKRKDGEIIVPETGAYYIQKIPFSEFIIK
ncbi:hypothetical protein [Christiangramia antarctica]|uniref:Uncharacterized protein n=1 Tax=Christiangramia antarctica TaxID=2058158 RepID=A0ABW5XA56_9FLAO